MAKLRTPEAAPPDAAPAGSATRDRLVAAAMDLFARKGFGGTTIGDIEEAAGLTRRGGAFYRHFESKADILVAGVDDHVRRAEQHRAALALLPFGDLRAELLLVCQWLLESLDEHRALFEVVEREGERFPDLRDRFREQFLEPALAAAVGFSRRWSEETGHPSPDPEASAIVMIGAALNYARLRWTFGEPLFGVDDRRFVQTWVRYCHDLLTGTSS